MGRVERFEEGSGKVVSSIRGRWLDGLLLVLLVAFAAFVFSKYGPFEQPIAGDASMQIYVAQQMIRGNPPYVTAFFPKTPLTGLAGAMAILMGRLVGISDVIAIRAMFFMVAVFCVPFAYLLARRLTDSHIAGVMVALALAFNPVLGEYACAGPQPKVLTMFLGLISLWALAQGSWFLGGMAGSLSFLSWQPGAIFIFLILAMVALSDGEERCRRFLRALLGVSVPLILVGVYLVAVGAFVHSVRQTLLSQLMWAYGGGTHRDATLVGKLTRPFRLLHESFEGLEPLLWLAVLGWALFTIECFLLVTRWPKRSWVDATMLSIGISGYFWLAFSLFDFEHYPDLIPFVPYLSFALGWLVWRITGFVSMIGSRWLTKVGSAPLRSSAGAILVIILLLYGSRNLQAKPISRGLEDQRVWVSELDRELEPNGRIQCFGHMLPLVLANRVNLTPLMHLGPKAYELVRHEPGGFEGVLDTIQKERPEMVLACRNLEQPWARPLLAFLNENYECYEKRLTCKAIVCRLRER